MRDGFTAAQRHELETGLQTGEPPQCPVCHVTVVARPVEPPAAVSYVRHRVWVMCPQCRRSASLDVK